MAEEKRKTINVRSDLDRPLMLHLHQTIADDGAGRAFFGRAINEPVTLQPGHNPGIDKEFFEKWKEQNKGLGMLSLFESKDED